MSSTGTPASMSNDYTLGYRPKINKHTGPGSHPSPDTRPSLADTKSAPPADEPPRGKRRGMANVFICMGFILILSFSVAALLFGSTGSINIDDPTLPSASMGQTQASTYIDGLEDATVSESAILTGTRLKIKNIFQNPELPNGCEVTSLTIILNYLGYDIDKMTFATEYLPREDYWYDEDGMLHGSDPVATYPGVPWEDGFGFYCYAGVVEKGANQYLANEGGSHVAKNLTGAKVSDLCALLDEGIPVMVWHTTDGKKPLRSTETVWYLYDTDELFTPYANMHVMVLTGYDEKYCYFCDPLGYYTKRKISDFEKTYEWTGSRALAIFEAEEESK